MKTRKIANILLAAAVVFCATACQSGFEQSKASKPRKIALHSYVYHKCATLEDVVDDAASMGVNGVVLSRKIKLGKYPNAKVGVDMTAEQKAYVKKLFAENKLEIASFGIGGDFEQCALLAKQALCRNVAVGNPDEFYAAMESEMLERVNSLGIGPQGFGGRTTALAVAIEHYPTHIAGLPVAVNINCHVTRHQSEVL